MAPQSVMFPGLHPAAMMSTVGLGNQQNYRATGFNAAGGTSQTRPQNPPQIPTETSYLYIPDAAVGAVIGKYLFLLSLFLLPIKKEINLVLSCASIEMT